MKGSTLISPNELGIKLSKLKEKCVGEFDDLSDFSEENMHTWIVGYVNLNNNFFFNMSETRENLIQVEREIFEIKIKKEISISPL
jgi:hypothetical protein